MKTKLTPRLENAITKLYTAFHEGELQANYCAKCAVGSIVGHGLWDGGSFYEYLEEGKPCVSELVMLDFNYSGYSNSELAKVEYEFLIGVGEDETKETQFLGLCAVVEYLCQLDGVENVMSYQRLFETEEDQPKYELNF